MFDRFHSGIRIGLACLLSVATPVSAQSQGTFTYNRTQALDESQSQAERIVEEKVSLSAEKIISLLQREPGLLLEFKKVLVRKAFEQGRSLEARDLTDDTLFRLINEDENIRVLATREIERRHYIRALPSRDELERERLMGGNPEAVLAANGTAANQPPPPPGISREDLYWQGRARLQANPPQQQYPTPRTQPAPPSNPDQETPGQDQNVRTVLRAQRRSPDTNNFEGDAGDSFQMPRVRPGVCSWRGGASRRL